MGVWSREAIGARVDELALEHRGVAFVAAVERFGHEALDDRERRLLYDVLMKRANIPGRISAAARERRRSGWGRRMLETQLGRRRPG